MKAAKRQARLEQRRKAYDSIPREKRDSHKRPGSLKK